MDPVAKGQDLLYVSDANTWDAYVYTFPQGKRVGALTGLDQPAGMCTDAKGDVWIANSAAEQMVEFAHGGRFPIATLADPEGYPHDCAVDPTTGDLAVTNSNTPSEGEGGVEIYKGAGGTPTLYQDPNIFWFHACTYDDKGNLFVNGMNYDNGDFEFAELAKGSGSFEAISLSATIYEMGGVQWHGNYVALGDGNYQASGTSAIYHVRISGSSGTIAGTTLLSGSRGVDLFWLQSGLIAGANCCQPNGTEMFWKYPAGGTVTKTLRGPLDAPQGSVVSLASHREPQRPSRPLPGLATRAQRVAEIRRDTGRSWMASGAAQSTLLYVSDIGTDDVYVYNYGNDALVGTLTGFDEPQGACVDAAGNIWITNTKAAEILEYAHGGTTPIATLSDPGEYPAGCAVDSTTGNLAVTNIYTTTGQPGDVLIYPGASGAPATYTDPSFYAYYFCGYDQKGNLFVDGRDPAGDFTFAKLPSGANSFTAITLNKTIYFPGGVEWDGKDIAVGDQGYLDESLSAIYRVRLAGTSGKILTTGYLTGAEDVAQFSLRGRRVVGPDQDLGFTGIWHYPLGGRAIKTIDGQDKPVGSAISPSFSKQ
jgi:sugar lactone lactonase YvrE